MADVRGASGAPSAGAFGGVASATPSTPIYVDSATGNAYVLIGGVVTQIGSSMTPATGLTSTGTVQGDALSITAAVNTVTTVAAGTGVVLNTNQTLGPPQVVYNGGANVLKVYPPSGGKINQLATNAAITLSTATVATFWRATSTQWIGSLSA